MWHSFFFTQCQDGPEARTRAVPGGCEGGVHVSCAKLVKYLHGHEFSICQGLLPWGSYHL